MKQQTLLTVNELLVSTDGYLYNDDSSLLDACFTSVVTDSRNVDNNSLFIPLVGENQDGHSYVEASFTKGASIAFVQKSSLKDFCTIYSTLAKNKKTIIVVDNTLKALQQIAKTYIQKFPLLKKIAVTGSNGKTTAKECIASVLSQKYAMIMNVGNLNSETGLPLSMFTVTKDHEVGVFEMGTNRKGEIKELADVYFPDIAIITNIGTAHIGILGTQQAIAEEKKQIFSNFNSKSVGFIFEDEAFRDYLAKGVDGTIKSYGLRSTVGISSITQQGIEGSLISLEDVDIHFPLIGEHNAQNAIAAITIAKHLGLTSAEIKRGLESVKPLFGRSEILIGEPTIIQDCYNGSYESMIASLNFFMHLEWSGKKIAILGDMLELGNKSAEIHENIIKKVMESTIDVVVFVGSQFSCGLENYNKISSKKIYSVSDIDDNSIANLCDTIKSEIDVLDILLCKGSRGIKLERAIARIQEMFLNEEYAS